MQKNFFDILMASPGRRIRTKSNESDKKPLDVRYNKWDSALRIYCKDPESHPDIVIFHDELCVAIRDKYPKARHHYLVMPRRFIDFLTDLRSEDVGLIRHLQEIGKMIIRKIIEHPEHEFRMGFHAVASMKQVHMHLISQDMCSPSLKNKIHWNSFTTDFFRNVDDVIHELKENGSLQFDRSYYESLLKRPLKCHRCDEMPANIPALKRHLECHESNRCLRGLAHDLSQLWNNPQDADVEFIVGGKNAGVQGDEICTFYAHRVILRCRSDYFNKAFSREWGRDNNGKLVFEKPNISPEAFSLVLRFIYTGWVDLSIASESDCWTWEKEEVRPRWKDEIDLEPEHTLVGKTLVDVLVAADEMLVHDLTDIVQRRLISQHTTYIENNAASLLLLSDRHSFNILKQYCIEIVCKDPYPTFFSEAIAEFDADLLLHFLRSNELRMKEADVWDAVLDWALRRCGLELDKAASAASDWPTDNLVAIRACLEPLLPHIRFFQMTPSDYAKRVKRLKIVPPKVEREILRYYNEKNYIPTLYHPYFFLASRETHHFSSRIITEKHRLLIDNWILGFNDTVYSFDSSFDPLSELDEPWRPHTDRKSQNTTAVTSTTPLPFCGKKFDWQILFRASQHGRDSRSFHRHCDNQGATIVILRVRGTGEILGGYNPDSWKAIGGGRFMPAQESFLFSFCASEDSPPEVASVSTRINSQETNGAIPAAVRLNSGKTRALNSGTYAASSSRTDYDEKVDRHSSSHKSFSKSDFYPAIKDKRNRLGNEEVSYLRNEPSYEELYSVHEGLAEKSEPCVGNQLSTSDCTSVSASAASACCRSVRHFKERTPVLVTDLSTKLENRTKTNEDNASDLQTDSDMFSDLENYFQHESATSVGHAPDRPTLHRLKPLHSLYAIYNSAHCGPVFGGGHDLYVGSPFDEPCSFARCYAYEGPLRNSTSDFAIDEMEVWRVSLLGKEAKKSMT
ncbi:uncharacterized protein VTP21DRAFT_3503 [Calcarisporiella thermophila]|uniref:uncharacterized protein n=1 Tax=Calcarisporiella thermophila TaxID=911321 RepID=UPI00374315B1